MDMAVEEEETSVNEASSISSDESVENKESDTEILLAKYEEKYKLSQIDKIRLRNLRVKLFHDVPPQHKIEKNAGSHAPTPAEKRRFRKFAPLKQGTYSSDEDQLIVRNWHKFCETHDWDKKNVRPFMYMRHKNVNIKFLDERKKFVQFLARGLPKRMLYSVYHRFKNLYEDHLQCRYTPREDEIILDYIQNNPKVDPKCMFSDLAKILNRTRASVWRRYRRLKSKSDQKENT